MTPPAAWADLPFFREGWPGIRARLMAETRPWAPGPDRVFRALELTPPEAVRVVILGQDPYHEPGRATGLAFGYPPGAPPRHSLANILRELRDDLGIAREDGDLAGWARQGVLLLNTVLSVVEGPGMAGSHGGLGWQALAADVIARVAERPTAFLLWGKPAQRAAHALDERRHFVLRAPHPSPLSAATGFLGHRPFSRVNAWLEVRGVTPIDWAA